MKNNMKLFLKRWLMARIGRIFDHSATPSHPQRKYVSLTTQQLFDHRRWGDHHQPHHYMTFLVILIIIFIIWITTIYFEIYGYLDNSTKNGDELLDDAAAGSSRSIITGHGDDDGWRRPKMPGTDKHGVHIIVGQYMGKGFPWMSKVNLTDDLIDSNNYSPLPGYGENGSPVTVPGGMAGLARRMFPINQFNLVASDLISVNRTLPDVRRPGCRVKRYGNVFELPDTTIIIVFHNEAWSTLVRTIHSVINRSPRQLLNEIILVDDASQRKFLAANELDRYLARLSNETTVPIRVLRSFRRIGLIRARIMGAQVARGQVLTFLDAHCECTIGWLEPLLYRIAENGKVAACPVIDIIHDQTFAYVRSFDAHWGAMNWALHFRWFSVGHEELNRMYRKNSTMPFRSPIMAGGLFSIRKDFFFHLGTYDSHLEVWGGENIEISLRLWQCGGRVEIVPCSHVGHVFRGSSPYSFGEKKQVGDVLYGNLIRVAEVWLDEWKNFFYRVNPTAGRILLYDREEILANITERIELRKRLRCRSFGWFLSNVWPENFFPTKEALFGKIQNQYSNQCIQRPSSSGSNPTGKVMLADCAIELYGPQSFVIPSSSSSTTKVGYIKSDESVCLDVNSYKPDTAVLLMPCSQMERQKWRWDSHSGQIIHARSGLCLTVDKRKTKVFIAECRQRPTTSRRQTWNILEDKWNDPF